MKLLKSRLKGFIGIKKGLGLDEIEFDLSGLSGLVALEGENGMGKTTWLENLQPFRTLPSRKGTLKTHCFLKDSEKELAFEFDGNRYRTLVKMNALTTTRDEGFIWKNNESVVDGLVRNYDNYLNELLGSQNLFFASIFCAQNSAKLSDMRPAELKALFAEFLQLDRYVAWEDTSKVAANIYYAKIEGVESVLKGIDTKMKMLGDPRADLAAGLKVAARQEIDIMDIDMKIEEQEARLKELKKETLDFIINQEKLIALNKENDGLRAGKRKLKEAFDDKEKDSADKATRIYKEIEAADKIMQLEAEIGKAVKTFTEADNKAISLEEEIYFYDLNIKDDSILLQNEKDRSSKIMDKVTQLKMDTRIREHTADMTEINRKTKALADNVYNIKLDPELVKIAARIEAMDKSAAVLDDIDPACTSEVCGLITQSLDDKKRLPRNRILYEEVRVKILGTFEEKRLVLVTAAAECQNEMVETGLDLDNQRDALNKELADINASIATVTKIVESHAAKQKKASDDRRDAKETKESARLLADRAAEILVAGARLKDLNMQINDIKVEFAAIEMVYLKESNAATKALTVISGEIIKVEGLINIDAHEMYEKANFKLKLSVDVKKQLSDESIMTAATVERCKREIDRLLTLESETQVLQDKKDYYLSQQSRWFYIRNACSKDGLRALEIEGVAPVITGYANDMLTGTFGPNHTVRFETQDEEGREVLDIVVIGDDGSETLLTNLSGGERVWILKALRLAQTLISQQKSKRHFQTALMDEEDGALSNANAIRFISLYGTLMKMANMEACYFISHRQDAIDMGDYQIKFKEGGISVI